MAGHSEGNQQSWWEQAKPEQETTTPLIKAVAYYRHSAQDRQENSVALQQEQVHEWARANRVEIIHEFADRGKSGLTAEGRDGFNDMMENWVKKRHDFHFVLCLDVSRWGRFQDIDLSATYSAECKRHGKEIIYTTIGKPKEGDPFYPVYIQFERFRSAQQSKELSEKVHRGCIRIAQQGYWAGGTPPYGFHRLLLDEARNPVQILAPGQHKGIQNQRVTLAWGKEHQVAAVQRIFHEFTQTLRSLHDIAAGLNREGIVAPGGGNWDESKIRRVLTNELYKGTLVYNKTTQKLKTPTRRNPQGEWIRTSNAFDPMVELALFEEAQRVLAQAALRYTPAFMLEQLERLVLEHEFIRPSLVRVDATAPSPTTYAKRFSSLDAAYQQVFRLPLAEVRTEVESLLRGVVEQVEPYEDFLVVNRKFTVLIQPSVPVPNGYNQYWYFHPDGRGRVDITLGVPVSSSKGPEILGYLVLPRLAPRSLVDAAIRIFGSWEAALVAARLDPKLALSDDASDRHPRLRLVGYHRHTGKEGSSLRQNERDTPLTDPQDLLVPTTQKSRRQRRPPKLWSNRQVLEAITARWQTYKPMDGTSVYREDKSLYRAATWRHRTWNNALLAAGLNPDEFPKVRKSALPPQVRLILTS